MQYLDLTLSTPAENLALDEALLDEAEESAGPREVLRLWESPQPMVVVGRSSKLQEEVRLDQCQLLGVPVLRRASGGAAVVAGPGCLMYAVVLSYQRHPRLRAIDQAHHFVLERLLAGLQPLLQGVACKGISDLVLGDRKFSGNSLRCRQQHLLYHGTILYRFPLELIGSCLAMPPRQPRYRQQREHGRFVANLPLEAEVIRGALRTAWDAVEPLPDWPRERTARLVAERYGRDDWHQRR